MNVYKLMAGASGFFIFLGMASAAGAAGVVGNGSPASCTEAALNAALNGGGNVTFNCGGATKTIVLTSYKQIGANTVIDGAGLITLSGGNTTSHFQVFSGKSLALKNITLKDGKGVFTSAGAVENFGVLVLENAHVDGNTGKPNGQGGAIYNSGSMTALNSSISSNTLTGAQGGGIFNLGSLTLNNSIVAGNVITNPSAAANVAGAGIYNTGDVVIRGGAIQNNRALFVQYNSQGGGIYSEGGSLTIDNALVADNAAYGAGGIQTYNSLAVYRASRFTGNRSELTGGAIGHTGNKNLTIYDSLIANNTANLGGGMYVGSGSTVTISRTRISANTATFAAGIRSYKGDLRIYQSLFDGNRAARSDGFPAQAGAIGNRGFAEIVNTTFSGNIADEAGAILNENISGENTADMYLTNVTMAFNRADAIGGIMSKFSAYTHMANTMIANSLNTAGTAPSDNCLLVVLFDNGGNLSSDASGCLIASGYTSANPQLGPLMNNGGNTLTHMPATGSIAINNGNNAYCPAKDQRNAARPVSGVCDIGAVEFGAKLPQMYLSLLTK